MALYNLPSDFLAVVNYRIYLDITREILASYHYVSLPPRFVIHLPELLNAWSEWANIEEDQKLTKAKSDDSLEPLGNKIKPDWLEYEFSGLEEFYKYINDLLKGSE